MQIKGSRRHAGYDSLMESLLAHCSAIFYGKGLLMLAFLMGGLTGSFTHCLVMCGPYVACDRMCHSPACGAWVNKTGLPYHFGRITTYSLLGFGAALFGSQLSAYDFWPALSAIMLACAGLLFLFSCIRKSNHSNLSYSRGMLLGFMPCGLLYAALMMAATLTNPIQGMAAMFLFAIGTVPALALATLGADFLSRKWKELMQRFGHVMMACNGISLLIMAVNIVR